MNSRKRPAAEPLLPQHSVKRPRTNMVEYDGGSSNSGEGSTLLARWKNFAKEFRVLTAETFRAIVHGMGFGEPPIETPASRPACSRSDSRSSGYSYDGDFSQPDELNGALEPELGHYLQQDSLDGYSVVCPTQVTGGPQVIFSRNTDPFLNLEASSSNHAWTASTASLQDPRQLHGPGCLLTPPCSLDLPYHATNAQNTLLPQNHSRVTRGYTSSNFPSPQPPPPITRKYPKRKHIYAKAHKAKVITDRQKMKEDMQREMYTLQRTCGYSSNFSDFQSLLAYEARLKQLDQKDVLPSSSSMVDLHVFESSSHQRRHSFQDNDDLAFLRRAFDRAKATLNEPRPPRPFQPTLDQLKLSQRRKDQDIEQLLRPKIMPPTPLPRKDDVQVDMLLKKQGIIAKFAREQINDQDLSRLRPSQWLNDEIMNFYGALILARSESCKENPPKNGQTILDVYYFSTFFWTKLAEGYEKGRLAKWTKKIDIFQKDVILIPVNHSNAHWTSAAINFRRKRIVSYDSMGAIRPGVFQRLRGYLEAEHQNKKKASFDFTGWQDYSIQEPRQENGYDCGVFTCQFLQGLSKGDEVIRFTQKDMPFLRRRMIWEICNTSLRDEP